MFAIIAVIISISSMAYSAHQASKIKKAQKRAKAEAERKAELAKGFQFVDEGNSKPLPIVYGRQKLGGNRVYTYVTNGVIQPSSWSGFLDFPTMKSIYAIPKQVHKLVNSNANWTGTWSLVPSSDGDFNTKPGWAVTAEDDDNWKFPSRTIDENGAHYTPPGVNYVFLPFQEIGGAVTFTVPTETLSSYGFNFPKVIGTIPSFDGGLIGEKNMMLYTQQALAHGGLSSVYTIDVDKRPYDATVYEYGQRIFVSLDGGVANPWMSAADPSRVDARFSKVAYATGLFALHRDDPQYDGAPEMQFYVQGNPTKYVEKSGNTYTLSSTKAPTSNPALILLDYLMSADYGKGLTVNEINLESFYWASQVCATRVIDHATKRGALWLANSNPRHINLYECNISLDTGVSIRENIQKILDTMSFATLVWADGKYSLNLPYAEIWNSSKAYAVGTVVQYEGNGYPQFFRREVSGAGGTPGSSIAWSENVIDESLRYIDDNYLEGDSEFTVSWPSADTKLNYCTVRFMNEDRDFSEDTASWPSKSPLDLSYNVYTTFLAEDNNTPQETEVYVAGCSTSFHARAIAEQRVRASRAQVDYTFTATPALLHVEPGDLIGFSSQTYNVPYTILLVESTEVQANGAVTITASTFDANFLAWNVADDVYIPPADPYEKAQLGQAYNLSVATGSANSKVSNYVLSWSKARDRRVSKYLVQYTTASIDSINEGTAWTEVGTVNSNSIELPPIEGTFTFTVVAMSAAGRRAPMRSHGDGSEWPYLRFSMSAGFLQTMSAPTVNLSNDNATIVSDVNGNVPGSNYGGTGTTITCYQGETQLVYDGVGTTNGTWNVTTVPAGVVNITRGNITSLDSFTAQVGDASVMTADTAYIDFTITGKTMTGVDFTTVKRQNFTKAKVGATLKLHYIDLSSAVMFKNAASASAPGNYTSVTAHGKELVGNTLTAYGYLTYTYDNGTETAVSSEFISAVPANNSGIASVTFKLYDDSSKTTLLDTAVVPVVYTGGNAISVVTTNGTHAIPCDDAGNVLSYDASGTDVYVFDGATPLTFNGSGTVAGTYALSAVASGIVASIPSNMTNYVHYGVHSGMTTDLATITYTATGKTFANVPFTASVVQTFSKVKGGSPAEYIYIDSSAPVIKKDSPAANITGMYTNITLTGKYNKGGVVTDYGYLTIQSDLDASESVRSQYTITTNIASTSNIASLTVRLYETQLSVNPLDTETIPVVFKGEKGSNAVSISLSNGAHAIPADLNGTVLSYANSGTVIYVYEGASRLVYDGVGATNGTWTFTRVANGITANGTIVDNGDFATVGDHSGITGETASVDYVVTGKSSEGVSFNLTATQTILKSRRGASQLSALLSNPLVTFSTDSVGTISSYTGTGTSVSAFEGATKLTYNGSGNTPGTYTVSASGTNISPSGTITLVNATDANYGVASGMTADTAKIVFTVTGKTLDGSDFVTNTTQSFVKSRQGEPGDFGADGSKTTYVRLYKWSTVQPAPPSGNSTYMWNTGVHKDFSGGDQWYIPIPSNPGTPGIALWQAEKVITATGSTSATAVDWSSGVTLSNLSQNGTAGIDGLKIADAIMYKWSISLPSPPTGSNVWTWSSLSMNAVTSANAAAGWSATIPAPTAGYTLYAAIVKLSDTASSSATTIYWTNTILRPLSYAGTNGSKGDKGDDGDPGNNGTTGNSYRTAYALSSVATASGSIPPTSGSSSFPPSGSWGLGAVTWSGNTSTPTAGQYLWQTDGIYNPLTNTTSWNTPYWSSLKVGNLSVISQNAGTITAGVLQNSAGTFVIDLNNGVISISV